MSIKLEDGGGNGRFATVNASKQLDVAATTVPIIADASHDGYAFSIVGRRTLASSNEENVLFVRNDNTQLDVHIADIRFSVNSAAAGVEGILYFDATYTSGGTAKTPVQLNRGSARVSGVKAYDGSGSALVLGTTSEEEFHICRLSGVKSELMKSDDAIILGPGDSLHITAKGTSADTVAVTVVCFEKLHESH